MFNVENKRKTGRGILKNKNGQTSMSIQYQSNSDSKKSVKPNPNNTATH